MSGFEQQLQDLQQEEVFWPGEARVGALASLGSRVRNEKGGGLRNPGRSKTQLSASNSWVDIESCNIVH